MSFKVTLIEEPDLVFGRSGEEKDPRLGLAYYGPYHYRDEVAPLANIKVGIIGNKTSIEKTIEILKIIKNEIVTTEPNKWLYASFPGMSPNSPFRCTIDYPSLMQETISDDREIEKLILMEDKNEKIAAGVELYVRKIQAIKGNDDLPNVIICALPRLIELHCGISEKTRGAKTVRFTKDEIERQQLKDQGQKFLDDWGFQLDISKPIKREKSFDFRNALKGKVMEYGIPIQILKESTADYILNYNNVKKKLRQEPSSFAWNFSTALYYKANGKPWRLAKLREDTCFVGISFFYDKLKPNKDTQISMAQVFTHTGEGLVLRGHDVIEDRATKQVYLSKEGAMDLLRRAIDKYVAKQRRYPLRVVVHKSSPFSLDEKQGFNDTIYSCGCTYKDFVSIKEFGVGINFLRTGRYPVLRGTLVKLTQKEYLLYASGFIPRLRTYPGHRIPNPLKLVHEGDSPTEDIAKEILGLTKLNWNTTAFATSLPITLEFAKGVGKILSELPPDKKIEDHYRFYM